MSEPENASPDPRARRALRRRRRILGTVAAFAAAAAGAAAAGAASHEGALAFADRLDLGTHKDRLLFALYMGGLGIVAGACLGAWLVLARLTHRASMARLVAGTFAALAVFAVAVGYFAFAVTMPPPPVQPYIVAQMRLGGHGWSELAVSVSGHRVQVGAQTLARRAEVDGSTLVDATLPVPDQSGVRAIILHRDGGEVARFSLDLPGDPPATANYSHWLTPDRGGGEAATIEMRFRIERRVMR